MNPTPTEWQRISGNCPYCLGGICADCQTDDDIILDWSDAKPLDIEWIKGSLLSWRNSYLGDQETVEPETGIYRLSAAGIGVIDNLLKIFAGIE